MVKEENDSEKGIDEGFVCKLDEVTKEKPEFQALINESKSGGVFDQKIKNYTLKAKNYQAMLLSSA